jgi:general secretion pathway protein K
VVEHRPRRGQRGAALLVAMVILTLVATLAAGMVWQQWRALQVETAERARMQAAWILTGALDWARLILREDGRNPGIDHLGEPWAVPLAEARLSTFLAVDRENNAAAVDDGPEAFLSGQISDAQALFNLRNLVDQEGKVDAAALRALRRLCENVDVPASVANALAEQLHAAWSDDGNSNLLAPHSVAELTWLGISREHVEALSPWLVMLPTPAMINLNTAPREVLLAVLEGLDTAGAERLVQARDREPFRSVEQAKALFGEESPVKFNGVSVSTNHFFVQGRIRLGDRVLEERSLVRRIDRDIVTLDRKRVSSFAAAN